MSIKTVQREHHEYHTDSFSKLIERLEAAWESAEANAHWYERTVEHAVGRYGHYQVLYYFIGNQNFTMSTFPLGSCEVNGVSLSVARVNGFTFLFEEDNDKVLSITHMDRFQDFPCLD